MTVCRWACGSRFSIINSRAVRFAVGAVNVLSGNFAYFDNAREAIAPPSWVVLAPGCVARFIGWWLFPTPLGLLPVPFARLPGRLLPGVPHSGVWGAGCIRRPAPCFHPRGALFALSSVARALGSVALVLHIRAYAPLRFRPRAWLGWSVPPLARWRVPPPASCWVWFFVFVPCLGVFCVFSLGWFRPSVRAVALRVLSSWGACSSSPSSFRVCLLLGLCLVPLSSVFPFALPCFVLSSRLSFVLCATRFLLPQLPCCCGCFGPPLLVLLCRCPGVCVPSVGGPVLFRLFPSHSGCKSMNDAARIAASLLAARCGRGTVASGSYNPGHCRATIHLGRIAAELAAPVSNLPTDDPQRGIS